MNIFAVAVLAALQASSPAPIPPSAPGWTVLPESACLAAQSYETPAGITTIGLRLSPLRTADVSELLVIRKGASDGDVQFAFGPPDGPLKTDSAWTVPLFQGRYAFVSRLDAEQLEPIRAAGALALVVNGQRVVLAAGELESAKDRMRQCNIDRLRLLGLDPELPKAVKEGAQILGDFGSRLPSGLPTALPKGWLSLITVIDPSGKATACKTWLSSGDPLVDQAYCKVFIRSRYRAARDAAGQPVTDYLHWNFTYRWVR